MSIIKATDVKSDLCNLIDEVAESHQSIVITGKSNNAVLISESDWNAINETLYLLSILGLRESIKEGLEEDISACSKDIEW